VSGEYEEEEIAMPEGLTVYLEPSGFTAYPNTTYDLEVVVAAGEDVPSGDYYLCLESRLENAFRSKGWITVTVE
jgi:hypothetical protein